MAIKYLIDENVMPVHTTQLRRKNSNLIVWAVGEVGTPPKSTLDPETLTGCEEHNFVLVTNNCKSMPVHLADHLAAGGHIPEFLFLTQT
jgi:hypothetical protein